MSSEKFLEAECIVCGGSIITSGRDYSSRATIASFKAEHAAKHRRESVFGPEDAKAMRAFDDMFPSVEEAFGARPAQDQGSAFALHYRAEFGKPTACGLGFLAHAVADWQRVNCEVCLSLKGETK